MNYFDGQFLRAQDFVDEQDHYTDRRERHNRLLHTTGVAENLTVSSVENDPTQVSISAGMAIDPLGREILVLATQSVKMPEAPTTKVEIYVNYEKTESDDSQDPGISGKTRITETPAIIVRRTDGGNADPVPPNGVLLAEVQLTAGQVNPVDGNPRNEVRKQATTPVGDDLTIRSLTLKREAVDIGQWPRLICSQAKQAALQGADLIVPDGKLGVGITNPESPLHVAGDIRWANNSRLQTDQGGSIELGGDRSTPGTGTPYIDFHFASDSPEDFNTRIINDANKQLTLNANRVQVTGELAAGKVTQTSDGRFKTSITPLSNTLEKVQRIRGVSFVWNELYESLGRPGGHREIGVIAQDVEVVFPELVSTSEEEGYKSLNYGRLTAVLIEAVKELKSALDEMKKRVDLLEHGPDNKGNSVSL